MLNYENSLTQQGYELLNTSQTTPLPSSFLSFFPLYRAELAAAGQTILSGQKTQAQLLHLSGPRSGCILLARIDFVPPGAQGVLYTKATYSLYSSIKQLPLPLSLFARTFLLPVLPVMAPGMMIMTWLANRARRSKGLESFPKAAIGGAFSLKYGLWGSSEEEVKRAFPKPLQECILAQELSGSVVVGPEYTKLEMVFPALGTQKCIENALQKTVPALISAMSGVVVL